MAAERQWVLFLQLSKLVGKQACLILLARPDWVSQAQGPQLQGSSIVPGIEWVLRGYNSECWGGRAAVRLRMEGGWVSSKMRLVRLGCRNEKK